MTRPPTSAATWLAVAAAAGWFAAFVAGKLPAWLALANAALSTVGAFVQRARYNKASSAWQAQQAASRQVAAQRPVA